MVSCVSVHDQLTLLHLGLWVVKQYIVAEVHSRRSYEAHGGQKAKRMEEKALGTHYTCQGYVLNGLTLFYYGPMSQNLQHLLIVLQVGN